jgi:FKBP-type peptidyl-prolyl cis-trans isomerase SlyD
MPRNFCRPMLAAAVFNLFFVSFAISAQNTKDEKVVKDGSLVSLQYTLTGDDGKLIESNKGKEPLKYTQGQREMIPGLEKAVAGMKVGQEKHITLKPEDAYGPVNKAAFQEIPKEKIPPEKLKDMKVGAVVPAQTPNGQVIPVRVHEVKEKTIVFDGNHPMAGKTLVFDVKIVDVQPGQAAQPTQPPQPPAAAKPAEPAQPTQPK